MKAILQVYGGEQYTLPPLLSWEVTVTGSVPCDSFSITCLYDAKMASLLEKAHRLTLVDKKPVLEAVIDEYEIVQDRRGRQLSLSGRGLMALLLDNESAAVEYIYPTLSELLRNHAAPCGIGWESFSELRGREVYSVSSGSSQWKALSGFTRYVGGFEPRITAMGKLQAVPWKDNGKRLSINVRTPVLKFSWKDQRYGVYSEVLVMDKLKKTRQVVRNQEFLARGGNCRRVLYVPGRSSGTAMRYTGAYQIEQSKRHKRKLTLVLPGRFWAEPGQVICMERKDIGITGDFYLEEWGSSCNIQGERTTLTMRRLED